MELTRGQSKQDARPDVESCLTRLGGPGSGILWHFTRAGNSWKQTRDGYEPNKPPLPLLSASVLHLPGVTTDSKDQEKLQQSASAALEEKQREGAVPSTKRGICATAKNVGSTPRDVK